LGRKNRDWDEGVREPPYIPQNLTCQISPTGDRIYPIQSNISSLDLDISSGLGLSKILQKLGPDWIYAHTWRAGTDISDGSKKADLERNARNI
jgi:hypothetical protein